MKPLWVLLFLFCRVLQRLQGQEQNGAWGPAELARPPAAATGPGHRSISGSILKIENWLVIFISGKADKEFWWNGHSASAVNVFITFHAAVFMPPQPSSGLTGQVMGFLFLIQYMMAWDELLKL